MGGCFFFIIFTVIVISVISNVVQTAKKQGGQLDSFLSGGGSLFQVQSASTTISDDSFTPPVKQPINWHILKLNLTKEQMAECFNLAAFRSGVKKKDFPKHVYLDKLRKYFSDAQLRDMIDLEFFEEYQRKETSQPSVLVPKLQGLACKTETGRIQPSLSSTRPKLQALACKTESGIPARRKDTLLPPSRNLEAPVREEVVEEFVSESIDQESVLDHVRSEEEILNIAKSLNLEDQECFFLEKISKRFSISENMELAMVLRNISSHGASPVDGDNPVSGIIWSEVLRRPNPRTRMNRLMPQKKNQGVEFRKI
jgi:hypothetical protein